LLNTTSAPPQEHVYNCLNSSLASVLSIQHHCYVLTLARHGTAGPYLPNTSTMKSYTFAAAAVLLLACSVAGAGAAAGAAAVILVTIVQHTSSRRRCCCSRRSHKCINKPCSTVCSCIVRRILQVPVFHANCLDVRDRSACITADSTLQQSTSTKVPNNHVSTTQCMPIRCLSCCCLAASGKGGSVSVSVDKTAAPVAASASLSVSKTAAPVEVGCSTYCSLPCHHWYHTCSFGHPTCSAKAALEADHLQHAALSTVWCCI
jgi:hypothetical protein